MKNEYPVLTNLGMNRNVAHFNIMLGEWRLIKNADVDKVGRVKKRQGYVKFLNVPDANKEVLSMIPFDLGGTRKMIMINAAGKLYAAATNAASWGTAILTGLSTTARWGYTYMQDDDGNNYMILGNGTETYKTADAATFSAVSGAPLAKYWATYQQRVYAAGVAASPHTLFWSSIGDITDWSPTPPSDSSSTDIEAGYKGVLMGIYNSNDRIVMWKERMMKRWNEEIMKTIKTSWGTEAPYSLADIDGNVFSYDREAIRLYDGNEHVPISFYIDDLIKGASNTAANLQRRFGLVFNKKYYLNIGTVTDEDGKSITNGMIVYDYEKNMFVIYSFADVMTAGAKLIDTNSDEQVYFGDSLGQCYKMFTGDVDDDTDIEMVLESHIFYPQGIAVDIEPLEMHFNCENPDRMKVFVGADFKQPIEQGEIEDTCQDIKLKELGLAVRGVKLILVHSTKGRPIFYGYNLDYNMGQR